MLAKLKGIIPERIKNAYHFFQAFFGALVFRFPGRSLKIIGVTGTDGKTTVVYLVHHILNSIGQNAAMVSTVGAKIGESSIETGLHVTTPSPIQVQKILRKIVDSKMQYAVFEATSHGLAQQRVAFVGFSVGVITNITHEHLDYHRTPQEYLAAKAKILGNVKFRVLNADDASYNLIKDQGGGHLVSFGIKKSADFTAKKLELGKRLSKFEIHYLSKLKRNVQEITSNLPGEYNVYNILAAFAVALSLGLEPERVALAISNFGGVPGRMQYIDEGQDFDVVVDFAHTPAALEVALKSLRAASEGKVIAVFGSAGERDIGKRFLMGKVATRLADYSVFTAEDPRGENASKIIEQIADGALDVGGIPNRTFWKIVDRAEAINIAIQTLARKKDTVAIFGKGHEKSMNIGGKEYPWSDEAVVRSALKLKLGKQ